MKKLIGLSKEEVKDVSKQIADAFFCENDVHLYGNLPGLKFTRTKTIGAGDDLCDFKMEIV